MSDLSLVACLLTPMIGAVLAWITPGGRAVRGGVSVVASATLVVFAAALLREVVTGGPLVAQMGGWSAPFGISLVGDTLAATLVLVAAVVGLAVAVYALADIDERRAAGGFDSFLQMLMCGVVGAFLTGDLFNLYVWFEVMLIASFALMVLGGDRVQLEGAVKYVSINLVSTVLLLAAIGMVYGISGTLNMADLAVRLAAHENPGLVRVIAVLFLVAFGIKAAVFPLYFWLPAAYHTPPIAVSALFAGLMTKIGVYAMLRTMTLVFGDAFEPLRPVVLAVALATMIAGVLGAMAHHDVRRILSWHVIASIGFMLLGLALDSPLAMLGALFYLLHGMVVKALLFMLAGIVGRLGGGFELARLGGLYRRRPLFSIGFLVAILSLIGIPPLAGFWAKVVFVEAGLALGASVTVIVILGVSLLSFVPLVRIWSEAFWKDAPAPRAAAATSPAHGGVPIAAALPVGALLALIVLVGLYPGPSLALLERAGEELRSPDAYLAAVGVDAIERFDAAPEIGIAPATDDEPSPAAGPVPEENR